MESKSRRFGLSVTVALVLFIVLAGCSDDSTSPVAGPVTPAGFVAIQADTFTMGSPADEIHRVYVETLHTVTLTTPFYMFSTELTNQQYVEMLQWAYDQDPPLVTATTTSLRDALDGSTHELLDIDSPYSEISFDGSTFTVESGQEDYPILEVTWYGAVAYCDWLSLHEGLPRAYDHNTWQCNGNAPYGATGYRLPTEAEWEYVCRAGTQTSFITGSCLDAQTDANYNGNYPTFGCPSGPYVGGTVSVGSYPANSFGIYDMHGNVAEWCNDWYGAYSGDETDPVGRTEWVDRVIRGGCWVYHAKSCRSAFRIHMEPNMRDRIIGFRPVRSTN